MRSITVNGTLLWSNGDNLELKSNWVMVESGGAFKIGSADKPFLKRATLTLTGSDQTENIMGRGTKCLCATGGGRLEIYDEDRLSWTKLSASAQVGETKLTLLEPGGWRAGEKIVIASSSFNPEEVEVRNITSVSSDGKTLTLETGLKYAHYGVLQTFDGKTLDERAEVGLLSRNIVIQGDDASSALKFGGHVMVMNNGSVAKIRGVEFKRMGQFNRLGRYPLHFHQMRDATGSFVASSSIHDTIQRGIVVHGSDNLRVERNVVYNTFGHAYSVEDGSERGTVFNANLGLLPQASSFTNEGLKDQDNQGAATFWLRTSAVTLTNNAITLSGGTLRDSLVVSRSANTDTLREWGETGMFAYGGYANAERVTWVGFKDGRVISRTNTCFLEFPRFSNTGVKLVDSDPAVGCGDIVLNDLDGSISKSGQPSKLVSSDGGLGLVSSACQKLPVNNVSVCPNYDYRVLNVQCPNGPTTQFAHDAWRVHVVRDGDGDRVTPKHYRWASYVIPEKSYHLEVSSTNASDAGAYSLAGLQTQTVTGYFADASKLSFKFFGGDQLRFERL